MNNIATDSFQSRLTEGTFYGVLKWPQLDVLLDKIKAGEWFFYQIGEEVPVAALSGEALAVRLDALNALLHKDHEFDFCGIVYADNLDEPTLVKVYDPNHIGTSCGAGAVGSPPAWLLSIQPPSRIDAHPPLTNSRKRWWQQLFN